MIVLVVSARQSVLLAGAIGVWALSGCKGDPDRARASEGATAARSLLSPSPNRESFVSIFEPHTGIIIKDKRDTEYGHKVCLTTGASALVTNVVVDQGNPADYTLALKMMQRQPATFGRPPKQASFDGGFAAKTNLAQIKALGVSDVVFHKRRGLNIEDMASSVRARLPEARALPTWIKLGTACRPSSPPQADWRDRRRGLRPRLRSCFHAFCRRDLTGVPPLPDGSIFANALGVVPENELDESRVAGPKTTRSSAS